MDVSRIGNRNLSTVGQLPIGKPNDNAETKGNPQKSNAHDLRSNVVVDLSAKSINLSNQFRAFSINGRINSINSKLVDAINNATWAAAEKDIKDFAEKLVIINSRLESGDIGLPSALEDVDEALKCLADNNINAVEKTERKSFGDLSEEEQNVINEAFQEMFTYDIVDNGDGTFDIDFTKSMNSSRLMRMLGTALGRSTIAYTAENFYNMTEEFTRRFTEGTLNPNNLNDAEMIVGLSLTDENILSSLQSIVNNIDTKSVKTALDMILQQMETARAARWENGELVSK